jgi:hypothetical protein
MKNKADAYLSTEVTQAWEHYRHMEETRTKYLSFYATVILTSAGFLVTLMKDFSAFDPGQFIASVSVFAFLLFVFSYFIWANITRIGFVLAAYEVILSETRKYMLGAESAGYHLWNVRARIPPAVSSGVFRIQSAASAIVLSVCLLLLSAEAYMSYVILSGTVRAPLWHGYVIGGFALLILALVSHGFLRLRSARKYQPPNVALSQRARTSSSPTQTPNPSFKRTPNGAA